MIEEESTEYQFLLRDSQLLTTLSSKEVVLHSSVQTPVPRTRMSSKFIQSPFLNDFETTDKGKEKVPYNPRQQYPFDGYAIYYNPPHDIINEFIIWFEKDLLRFHNKRLIISNYQIQIRNTIYPDASIWVSLK